MLRLKASLPSLLLCALLLASCDGNGQVTAPVKIIERELDLGKLLPLGSQPSTITDLLDQEDIEHSGFIESEQTIHAILRTNDIRGTAKKSVRIDFKFDDDKKLLSINVRDQFTGL